jgi:uncharacterized protein (DUF58 family)
MTTIPTKRFWLLVALGIPLAALAAAFHVPLLIVAYNALLLIAAAVSVRLAPSAANLRLRRKFDTVLSVREANRIELQIENDGNEPISFQLRDEPPLEFDATERQFRLRLAPGQVRNVAYHVTPYNRGSAEFLGTFVRMDCPWGLALREERLATEEPVRVYPNVLALREFDLLKQQGRLKEMGIRRARFRGLGTEFESMREYVEGDDYRKIDWKASARRGRLVVRQYEQERNQSVILCIDIGRHMLAEVDGVTKLDHVLDALLMLTHAAALAGDFVGLMVYADTVRRYVPPRKGRNQVGVIIEAMHDLVAEPVEPDPVGAFAYLGGRWKRRSLIVNFTDYEDEDRARDLAVSFGSMARRHLALVCRVHDPKLEEALARPIGGRGDMYLRAAATMLMEDRVKAQAVISAAGIHSLQAEPQELAAKLVSYYFMVKERSLL